MGVVSGGMGRAYLNQQLEACDPLERQNEEGGERQPLALGVQFQLCDEIPKGGLLLTGGHRSHSWCLALAPPFGAS